MNLFSPIGRFLLFCIYIALLHGKPVAAFIFGMTCVSLDPVEGHLMLFQQRQELLPEVYIECGLLVGFYPALFLPAVYPALCDAVHHIFAVGGKYHPARLLECGKSRDNAEELHSVVGGGAVAARKLLFHAVIAEHNAVSSGTGITAAGAVCEDLNCFDKSHL